MSRDLNRYSSKKTYRWPTRHEKMLNITNYQGNANQNHSQILLHTSQNGHYKNKKAITNVSEVVEYQEPSYTVDRNGNGAAIIKSNTQVHQKVTNRTIRWSSNFTLGYISKENKTAIQKDICTSVSIAVLFIIAKTWKQPINKSMDKCMRLLLSHKLNEIYMILYKKATVLLLICTLYLIDITIYIFYIDTHLQIFKLELT